MKNAPSGRWRKPLAYNFNNDSLATPPADTPSSAPTPAQPDAPTPEREAPARETPVDAALVRFRSCRWQQPAEAGNVDFCSHREVKPYAGTTGFDPSAWCPECQYYKLRRTPKKRPVGDDYAY
jgi:hypothetical protein